MFGTQDSSSLLLSTHFEHCAELVCYNTIRCYRYRSHSKPESTSSNKIGIFTRSCPCFARIYRFTSSAPSEIRTRTVMILSHMPLPIGLPGQNTGQTIQLSTHPHPPDDFPKTFLNGGQGRIRTDISTRNFLIYDLSNMSKNFSLVILYKRFRRILRKKNHFFFQESETGLEPA